MQVGLMLPLSPLTRTYEIALYNPFQCLFWSFPLNTIVYVVRFVCIFFWFVFCVLSFVVLTWYTVDVMPPNWHECPHLQPPSGNNQTIRAGDSVDHVLDENSTVRYVWRPMLSWWRWHFVRQTKVPIAKRIPHVLWTLLDDDCRLQRKKNRNKTKKINERA